VSSPSAQFRARGLSGWYVVMVVDHEGRPYPGVAAHSTRCYVPTQDHPIGPDSPRGEFAAVPVEEVPADTKPCEHCGGGALKRWRAGKRP
jgi:hypothetical protein